MDNLELGLHDLIGDEFLEERDHLFGEQGVMDFPEGFGGPDDDLLAIGLEVMGNGSSGYVELEEDYLRQELGPFHRSFSMNDIQGMQPSNPPAWGRQVSIKPTLESVPEGNSLALMKDETCGGAIEQPAAMNLPPLSSQQMNYSYIQYAGMPSQNGHGRCNSSDSVPEPEGLDAHSAIDGPPRGPSMNSQLGSLQRSYPSMGSLTSQMDNKLNIQHVNSNENLHGLDHGAGGEGMLKTAGMHAMLPPPGNQPSQQPLVQKSSGPSKQGPVPGGWGGYKGPSVLPGTSYAPGQRMNGSPMDAAPSPQHTNNMARQQQQQQQGTYPGPAPPPAMPKQQPSGMPLRKSQSALELVSWRGGSADLASMWGDPAAGAMEQLHEMQGFRVGRLTPEERLQRILRYRQKRQERNFNRTIKYQCRKSLADTRPRVRGRFARSNDVGIVLPHETKKAQREREKAQAQQTSMMVDHGADTSLASPGGISPGSSQTWGAGHGVPESVKM